jgi:CDP-6-deoxy-D-xylo-4-hexulose-3-dehydrase
MNEAGDALRAEILKMVGAYHRAAFPEETFVPGETPVRLAGRVFDAEDLQHLVESALDFWLTTGRFARQFEGEFARFFGAHAAVLCNSGSSANLLAVSALTSPKLGDRRLRPGDEVITVAAGFPTTVNPIIQNGLVPVFVDIDLQTGNVDAEALRAAVGPRTRAIILAHTLGNPFDLGAVTKLAQEHDLWLIEDNCDALGSRYQGRPTGSFGHLATASFYPAHHITMGEGGCVVVNKQELKPLVESFRDWGRDCWCDTGKDNTCGRRFQWQLGDLPCGYDHKYIYSHIGYNLKVTDMQAAIGVSQLKKLPAFIEARQRNWRRLHEGLSGFEEYLILPRATAGSDPSWFGFLMTLRPEIPLERGRLAEYLEDAKIATRMLFGGNLTRQPAYRGVPHRVSGTLANTDLAMHRTFWIGVYPGISDTMIDYVLETFRRFFSRSRPSP